MNFGFNIFFPSVGKWPFRQFKTKGGLSWGSISGQSLDDKGPYETLALPCSGPLGRLLGPVSGKGKDSYKNLIHRPVWDFDPSIIRALLRLWPVSGKDPSRTMALQSVGKGVSSLTRVPKCASILTDSLLPTTCALREKSSMEYIAPEQICTDTHLQATWRDDRAWVSEWLLH